jgi:hypothetical protein
MRYLTLQESIRRLKAAGVDAGPRTVRDWIREERVRDIWVLGRHTYIYEAELDEIIASHRA